MTVVVPVEVDSDPDETHTIEITTREGIGLTQILGMVVTMNMIEDDHIPDVLEIIRKIGVAIVGEEAMDKAREEVVEQMQIEILGQMDIDPTA